MPDVETAVARYNAYQKMLTVRREKITGLKEARRGLSLPILKTTGAWLKMVVAMRREAYGKTGLSVPEGFVIFLN